jgi:hypothetical protein
VRAPPGVPRYYRVTPMRTATLESIATLRYLLSRTWTCIEYHSPSHSCRPPLSVTHTELEPGRNLPRMFDNIPSFLAVNAPAASATSPWGMEASAATTNQISYTWQTSPDYIRHATADNPRIPWNKWSGFRTRERNVPTCRDKWWSSPAYAPESTKSAAAAETAYSHACRIMETDLGEQLFGDTRCGVARGSTGSAGDTPRRPTRAHPGTGAA